MTSEERIGVIEQLMRDGDYTRALEEIDGVLAHDLVNHVLPRAVVAGAAAGASNSHQDRQCGELDDVLASVQDPEERRALQCSLSEELLHATDRQLDAMIRAYVLRGRILKHGLCSPINKDAALGMYQRALALSHARAAVLGIPLTRTTRELCATLAVTSSASSQPRLSPSIGKHHHPPPHHHHLSSFGRGSTLTASNSYFGGSGGGVGGAAAIATTSRSASLERLIGKIVASSSSSLAERITRQLDDLSTSSTGSSTAAPLASVLQSDLLSSSSSSSSPGASSRTSTSMSSTLHSTVGAATPLYRYSTSMSFIAYLFSFLSASSLETWHSHKWRSLSLEPVVEPALLEHAQSIAARIAHHLPTTALAHYEIATVLGDNDHCAQAFALLRVWVPAIRSLAESGDWLAQFAIAKCLDSGWGCEKHKHLAVEWYAKAAKQKHLIAQYNLGFMYFNGRGVPVDKVEARRWYTKASKRGLSTAHTSLGFMYSIGDGGVEQDLSAAIELYRKAKEKGDGQGTFNLAWMLSNGKGVEQDKAAARALYAAAAELGLVCSYFNLALMCHYGEGGPEDKRKAFELYLEAAEHDHESAQWCLAQMFEHGDGIPADLNAATQWYLRAARHGNPQATDRVRYIFSNAKVNWSPRFHVHFPKDSVRDPIETLLILHLSIRDHDSDEYSYIPRFPECPVHTLPLELLWMIAEWVVICVRYDVLTPTLETSNG